MALTKISTDGVKDDAVTTDKLANAINTERTANTAKTSTTINNNADNRVITGSGTANTLEGESGLTFDGQALTLGSGYLAVRQGSLPQVDIQHSTDTSYSRLYLAQSSGSGGYFAINKIGTNGGGYTGGSNSAQLWSSANAPMVFATNNTEKVRIQAGGGISFNGDTAAANALDDYEEGTFTPTMANSVTLHSGNDLLSYVKVGHLVHVTGVVRINSGNSGADFNITNMPFATVNASDQAGNAIGAVSLYENNMNSGYTQVICVMNPNSIILNVQNLRQSGNNAPSLDCADNGYIGVSICYRAA